MMFLSISPSHSGVSLRSVLSTSALLFLGILISAHGLLGAAQSATPGILLVTPSTSTLLVGEGSAFSAVDQNGRPLLDVKWSLEPDLADLEVENGEASIQAKKSGRAILTASYNDQNASTVISVLAETKLPAATVQWSLQPLPGYETLFVMQAVPNPVDTVFFSIEWSKTAHAIVRAVNVSGQQLWATQLASTVSPETLKNSLPATGQVYQNESLLSDHSLFIIGSKNAFAQNNATDPSAYNLPADKESMLLRAIGDFTGGLVLLERGRLRDSLAFLKPADGSEGWRYHSPGRLNKSWTANYNGDIGIVETIANPASSALLIINAATGEVRYRFPFPISSSTVDGYRCADPQHNILKSLRPSLSGSVFTNSDGNIYVQVETHIESETLEACKNKAYSFDDSLALLRVSPEGEAEWTTFQHIHADGTGDFAVQPRVFAGETIPDGFGGVLAAWTYVFPGSKDDKQIRTEARLSRIGPEGQRDFTLPMPWWTKGLNSFFDSAMVLGDGNFLYATNGPQLLRFDTQAGELNWIRHPPTGEVKLKFATAGGGVLVANAGVLSIFNAQGFGQSVPWTIAVTNPDDLGLVQTDPFDHSAAPPLQLRDLQTCWAGNFIAVEDGAPYGHGTLVYFGQ